MYNSFGSSLDWAKSEGGIKWTFLLELPPTHKQANAPGGFHLRPHLIKPTARSVFEGFKTVAQEVYNSVLFS